MAELINLDAFSIDEQGPVVFERVKQEFAAHRQFVGAWPAEIAQIENGILTPSHAFVVVDAEGSAPADDLDLIAVTSTHDGMELKLIAQDSRTITVRHNPDAVYGIALSGDANITLDAGRFLLLKRFGDRWREIVDGRAAKLAESAIKEVRAEVMTAVESVAENTTIPGLVSPFSGAMGGPSNKHPINRKTGEADISYALCDGGTYTAPDGTEVTTPDLRDRFIVGAGGSYAAGAVGGSTTHTHGNVGATTLGTDHMPSHTHGIYFEGAAGSGSRYTLHNGASGVLWDRITYTGGNAAHTHSTGTVTAMPPYYALCYIMKL